MANSSEKFNMAEIAAGRLTPSMITDLVTTYQQLHSLSPVDGKAGAATRAHLSSALKVVPTPVSAKWLPWDGPESKQPVTRADIYEMFGNPGVGKADSAWVKNNIVGAEIPGLPKKIWVNKRIEPYLREAVRRVLLARPDFKIVSCAAHVFRHTRHDPKLPLSYHSWGIAVDFNPDENFGKEFPKGKAPELWSSAYNSVWPPGPRVVDQVVIDAMASCGFASGVDWNEDGSSLDTSYFDVMHFEWVARDGKDKMV